MPSESSRSTPSSSASWRALSVIALSQPWSAPGALNATLTARPETPPVCLVGRAALLPSRLLRLLGRPLVQAVSARVARATRDEYSGEPHVFFFLSTMRLLLEPDRFNGDGWRGLVAALQGHGSEDECTLDDPLDLVGHVEQVQQVKDQAEGDDAEEGAGHSGLAARQGGPANDHGCDRVQLD